MSLVNILSNWVKEDAQSMGINLTDSEAEKVIVSMENDKLVIDCYNQTLDTVQKERNLG